MCSTFCTTQFSLFGSILTFGAMIGAITSGPIADYIGRKGVSLEYILSTPVSTSIYLLYYSLIFIWLCVTCKQAMRMSSAFCVAGWFAIYFAQVYYKFSFPIHDTVLLHRSYKLITIFSSSKGALSLDIGRLATGYGMGVFSYVVHTLFPRDFNKISNYSVLSTFLIPTFPWQQIRCLYL